MQEIKLKGNLKKEVPLRLYLAEKNESGMPFVLVIPGGGYKDICEREAEPVAKRLNGQGISCAVLYYSVGENDFFPTALTEAGEAVGYIKDNLENWGLDTKDVALMGFSAGGHLAASLGAFYDSAFLWELTGRDAKNMQPYALILSYPVITAGKGAHENSFKNLLGKKADDRELREQVSIEKQVTKNMPPAFVWTTREDGYVPVVNSMLLCEALNRAGVFFELHIFPTGEHGAALCTPETIMEGDPEDYEYMRGWFSMAMRFLKMCKA